MAGQGRRFASHSLHEITIRAHAVHVVVEYFKIRAIEIRRQPFAGDRHAHAVSHSLTEWSSRGFHAGSDMRFGMPRSLAAQLPEAFNFLHRHRELFQNLLISAYRSHPREMKHGIKQHRGVSVGEHEAIAVGPDRVEWIEAHDAVPDRVDQRRQGHRRPGMSRIGLLDRVHR